MKKCIVISDSFKGSLTSRQICDIARSSIPRFFPHCQLLTLPVADGGEGTVAAFLDALEATPVCVEASGPYGQLLRVEYARKGRLAIVEMAGTAGLPLVGDRPDPAATTTYGVGQVIRHAVEGGCTQILLGLGGSATNDGGCGAAAALGVDFYDHTGQRFIPTGGTLDKIARIDPSGARALLDGVQLTAMCDVDNPLYGPQGAAAVFAPQKGADPELVKQLDRQLRAFDLALQTHLDCHVAQVPGAGAAGGMGAGCLAFFNARLKSGIQCVLDTVEFDRLLEGADLVITGEGRIDGQSLRGKVISGIAARTAPRDIPLLAIVGAIHPDAAQLYDAGVSAMFSIDRAGEGFPSSAPKAGENYRRTLEDVLRLIRALHPDKL